MQARRSHRSLLRRVALTAALAALVPAGVAEAAKTPKKPVVTSISPMQANIGDTITIRGRNFLKGKARNTVAFRRDGAKTVFVKADVATLRQIRVKLPETLAPFLQGPEGAKTFTTFRVRVLARRFGKSFTAISKSPKIGPAPLKPGEVVAGAGGAPAPALPGGAPGAVPTGNDDCDEDKVLNKNDADDDNDLLDDTLEKDLMTDACSVDSDGDKVEDGFEYKSAVDLNNDEYQQPNTALPYPGKRPYPNPLFADADADFDGDGLKSAVEYELWKYTYSKGVETSTRTLFPLSYSDGLQYSVHGVCQASGNPVDSPCSDNPNSAGRRYPTLKVENYERWFGPKGFYTWLQPNGYANVVLGWYPEQPPYSPGKAYHILDSNLSGTVTDGGYTTAGVADLPNSEPGFPRNELYAFSSDGGKYLSDEERDEDADGLSNIDELRSRMTRPYWEACYSTEKLQPIKPGELPAPMSLVDADSDGDGVRDGADDIDNDDVPNIMEISRMRASGFDDTEDGSTPPVLAPGEPSPPPTVGGGPTCKLDKELPPKGEEGQPKPMWHGPDAYGRVNPFNPCLPFVDSRTCPRGTTFGEEFTPLDESPMHHQWFSLQ